MDGGHRGGRHRPPAIADGVVYFTTWAGEVFAVREDDGKPLWRKNLTQELHSQELSSSRSTPVVHEQYLFVGINGPALQLALDRGTGNLLWSTPLDPHPDAVISCSGTVFERCTPFRVSPYSHNIHMCSH
jgi:outer membrane protein assembly factor BamB